MLHRSVWMWTPRFTSHVGNHPGILLGGQLAFYPPANAYNTCAINTPHSLNVEPHFRRDHHIRHSRQHSRLAFNPPATAYNTCAINASHSINLEPHCQRDHYIQHSHQHYRYAPYLRLQEGGPLVSTSAVNIMSSRGRFSKRQRVPSGNSDRRTDLKVQRTKEMERDERPSRDRKSESGASQRQGFTQGSWPKDVMECQWRRTGIQFKSEHGGGSQSRGAQTSASSNIPPSTRTTSAGSSQSQTSLLYKWFRGRRPSDPSQHGSASKPVPRQPTPNPSQLPVGAGAEAQSFPGASNFANMYQRSRRGMPCASQPFTQPSCGFHSSGNMSEASSVNEGPASTYSTRLWLDLPWQKGHAKPHHHSSGKGRKQEFEFSIVSYNILAQSLLEANNHLYGHCQSAVLPWEYRSQSLLEELMHSDADIFCLQEVDVHHFQHFFKPNLEQRGYASIYKKRTGDKTDGCATFYKRGRFQEVAHTKLEYQRRAGCLDRDNVAIITMLRPKGFSSKHHLCVANTHLLWNPRRGDIKLAQLGLLFAEIERLSHIQRSDAPNTYHPVVLCGDFNSVPHCPLYKFVKKGYMTYEGMAAKDVSGQEDGRSKHILTSPLWPPRVGVTERCYYDDRDIALWKMNTNNSSQQNTRAPGDDAKPSEETSRSETNPPGSLQHPFIFSSVYEHHHGNHEITTNHSRTNCTVDYIFFTRAVPQHRGSSARHAGAAGKETPNFTSDVSLVKRLALFTDSEVRAMEGLPNAQWSSDHLSLQARLCITPIT